MLQWFRRRAEANRKAGELYGRVVAGARHPAFYEALGVPDTPEGRFELIALHLFLALESLKGRGKTEADLSQRTIEAFVVDMDDCLREMGVGDLTVPKKVKRAAAAFYERAAAYRQGLAANAPADLERRIAHYVYADAPANAAPAAALADYIREAAAELSSQSFDEVTASGKLARLLSSRATEVT
jgi:cytochrome b pre-mRNA-processing protein 3